jgi:hypothetical protein
MKSRYEVFISVNIVIRRDYETSRVTEKKQIEQIEVQKWRNLQENRQSRDQYSQDCRTGKQWGK